MSIVSIDMHVVALPQAKALIPLTEDLREKHEIPFLALTDEGLDEMPKVIERLTARAKRVAYVEAEFFSGTGTQAAAIYEGGRLVFGPLLAENAISQALQQLGVSKDGCCDEFEALNLGRHRHTEDWR